MNGLKNKTDKILSLLEEMHPNAHCELNYTKPYELLIAVMLSAQTTDKRVNMVTLELFNKYPTLELLRQASYQDVEDILHSLGNYRHKTLYLLELVKVLLDEYDGIVPQTIEELTSLPGIGIKCANVVLSEIYQIPRIAVDTHVYRVSYRLGFRKEKDSLLTTEKKLMKLFPQDRWIKLHHQLIFLGRYTCKAQKTECNRCLLQEECSYFKKNNKKPSV